MRAPRDDVFRRAEQQNGRDVLFEMTQAPGQRVKPELNTHLPIGIRLSMIEIDHIDHLETNSMAHRQLKGQIEGFPGVIIQIGHIQQRSVSGVVFLSTHLFATPHLLAGQPYADRPARDAPRWTERQTLASSSEFRPIRAIASVSPKEIALAALLFFEMR